MFQQRQRFSTISNENNTELPRQKSLIGAMGKKSVFQFLEQSLKNQQVCENELGRKTIKPFIPVLKDMVIRNETKNRLIPNTGFPKSDEGSRKKTLKSFIPVLNEMVKNNEKKNRLIKSTGSPLFNDVPNVEKNNGSEEENDDVTNSSNFTDDDFLDDNELDEMVNLLNYY